MAIDLQSLKENANKKRQDISRQTKHKKERKKNQDEIVHTGCKMNY